MLLSYFLTTLCTVCFMTHQMQRMEGPNIQYKKDIFCWTNHWAVEDWRMRCGRVVRRVFKLQLQYWYLMNEENVLCKLKMGPNFGYLHSQLSLVVFEGDVRVTSPIFRAVYHYLVSYLVARVRVPANTGNQWDLCSLLVRRPPVYGQVSLL